MKTKTKNSWVINEHIGKELIYDQRKKKRNKPTPPINNVQRTYLKL